MSAPRPWGGGTMAGVSINGEPRLKAYATSWELAALVGPKHVGTRTLNAGSTAQACDVHTVGRSHSRTVPLTG